MKNVNFLLDRLPSIDELNDLLQNMIESSGNFVNYMMNIQDVTEILAVDILGVVPDDESIVIATNKGEPSVNTTESRAGQAYRNIVQRLLGEDVPIISFEQAPESFMEKLKKLFKN